MGSRLQVLSQTSLTLGLAVALVACRPPERGAGVHLAHPGAWGQDLITIYEGTFTDDDHNIRIRRAPMQDHALVVNFDYPTSGPDNANIDALIDEHLAFLLAYLDDNPEASATLTGFSQGGCLVLDLLTRVAAREPRALPRISAAVLAPARGVRAGKHTKVAKRMIARCAAAEASLVQTIEAESSADASARPVTALIGERMWIGWSCTDEIVGHDTFETLPDHVGAEHLLYRQRLRHMGWTGKDQDPSPEGEVYLASSIALAISQGEDPRAALADFGGFDEACDP